MSAEQPEKPRPIQFLNPEFWAGHMIGDDCPTALDAQECRIADSQPSALADFAARRFAYRTLLDYLESTRDPYSVTTAGPGNTFEPADWPAGTVVHFEREYLQGTPEMVAAARERTAAAQPSDSSAWPQFARPDLLQATYWNTANWGVVVPVRKSRPMLLSISSTSVKLGDEQHEARVNRAGFSPYPVPVRIGAVRHGIDEKTGEQVLERVFDVQVMAQGRPNARARLRSFGLLGRLASDPTES